MGKNVELVKSAIQGKKVFVVSKSWCGFCRMAKGVLAKYNIPSDNIEILEIDSLDDCDEIQDYMKRVTGGRSVPRVFIGGKFVGGGDETRTLDRQGKLRPMLEEVGAI